MKGEGVLAETLKISRAIDRNIGEEAATALFILTMNILGLYIIKHMVFITMATKTC